MQALEIFPVDQEYIEVEGIETFLRFARFDPDLPSIFIPVSNSQKTCRASSALCSILREQTSRPV